MTPVSATILQLVLLLAVALVVAAASRFARVPYTVGLVLAGLGIGLLPHRPSVTLTPDLVMFVFLPALLFAGAWTLPVAELRRQWFPILLLATAGVVIGIAVSYLLLVFGAHLDYRVALIFGAAVAATDPVAVLALFRELGVDRRLSTIVEGESLFNDGTAVVAYRVLVLATAGGAGVTSLHPADVVGQFMAMSLGGAAVGIAIGLLCALALRRVDDYLLEASATAIIAYASYLAAEQLHVSGIISVIAAGLCLAGYGTALGSFRQSKEAVDRLWEFIAFLANSVLFVLMGLSINLSALVSAGAASAWGIAAILLARVVVVYGLSAVSSSVDAPLPRSWQHVLALGGLRGALPMALVLGLPENFQHRSELIAMVYSVVLFTLIAQGLSLGPAVRAAFVAEGRNGLR